MRDITIDNFHFLKVRKYGYVALYTLTVDNKTNNYVITADYKFNSEMLKDNQISKCDAILTFDNNMKEVREIDFIKDLELNEKEIEYIYKFIDDDLLKRINERLMKELKGEYYDFGNKRN